MLRVYGDQISGWYDASMSQSNAFNWKGYKTPFRRSGHTFLIKINNH